jgi:hypothetical protein
VQTHQAAHPLLVHPQPGAAQFVVHPGHAVVAVGDVEDLPHQLDEFGLGDLPPVRAGRLALAQYCCGNSTSRSPELRLFQGDGRRPVGGGVASGRLALS